MCNFFLLFCECNKRKILTPNMYAILWRAGSSSPFMVNFFKVSQCKIKFYCHIPRISLGELGFSHVCCVNMIFLFLIAAIYFKLNGSYQRKKYLMISDFFYYFLSKPSVLKYTIMIKKYESHVHTINMRGSPFQLNDKEIKL